MLDPLFLWSIGLDIAGAIPVILLRKKRRIAWLVYIAVMGLWIAFSIIFGAYGFIPGCLIYSYLYFKNWKAWK